MGSSSSSSSSSPSLLPMLTLAGGDSLPSWTDELEFSSSVGGSHPSTTWNNYNKHDTTLAQPRMHHLRLRVVAKMATYRRSWVPRGIGGDPGLRVQVRRLGNLLQGQDVVFEFPL